MYSKDEEIIYGDIKENAKWISIVKKGGKVNKQAVYKQGELAVENV